MKNIKNPLLRYHGAKFRLAQWITGFFPQHEKYVEPFGGSAGVMLKKLINEKNISQTTNKIIYNEKDNDIVNLFLCIKNPACYPMLWYILKSTPYSKESLEKAFFTDKDTDFIQQAANTLIRSHMGFAPGATTGLKTGLRGIDRPGNNPSILWSKLPELLLEYQKLIKSVEFYCDDYRNILKIHDSENTLFYIDPPYLPETRGNSSKKVYRFEMSRFEHEILLEDINRLSGKVVISGYDNDLYDNILTGWHKVLKTVATSSKTGSISKQEVLWLKPCNQ